MMRKLVVLTFCFVVFLACKQKEEENDNGTAFAKAKLSEDYTSYGATFADWDAAEGSEISAIYESLQVGDTLNAVLSAPITSVCAAKGCWMRLDVPMDDEVFVKFKEYAFFVPLDASGEAVVKGKAFIEEVSVEERRHMAEDAGKAASEIAAITSTQKEFRFLAEGVLIKNK